MTSGELKVLIVEDSEADFLLIERYLRRHFPAIHCRLASSREELETSLRAEDWDVALSDYNMPGMDFLDTKDLIFAFRPDTPVILVSGSIGEERAVELIKQGVWDFVLKDNMLRLESAITRALKEAKDSRARHAAEEALRASENKYRILFESIPQRIVIKDSKSVFLTCNQNFARELGIEPEELVGRTDYDFFPKDLADKYRADDRRIMERGISEALEERYVRPGREIWVQAIKTPIRDEDGKVSGILDIFWDITESRMAAQKLKEQAELLDITLDAIFVRDMRHDITYWNKGAEKIFGWSAAEAIGRNADELLGTHAPDSMHAYTIVLEKGEWSGEFQRKSRDGRQLMIRARWTVVRDPRGEPRGILAVNTDVTEQRLFQKQLFRAQRLESVGTLAGGIAHDLNNILSPILMGVEALSLESDESSRRILGIMKTAAQRGAAIVRQVLSFARGIEGERAEVQLKHIISEINELIREVFPKAITIDFQVPKGLLPVRGDPTQLHQVLMNLCVNARDAMPEGGILTLSAENVKLDQAYSRMHVEARPIRYVVLKVEDNGTGMAPEILDKIFDPFFTTKGAGKGTGLGLSTSHSIVKSHGGFINAYSEVGKGSIFKVYIPAIDQAEEVDRAENVQEGIPMGEGQLILVVDDEVALGEITQQILESYGYHVLLARDGTEAVVLYAQRREDIRAVFTDMMMPYMDGAATIRALRKIDPTVKIISTSGLATSGQAKEAAGLGVDAFLAKPYTAEALLLTLRDVLGPSPLKPDEEDAGR